MSSNELAFVNWSGPGGRASAERLSIIRRHAMKGIGRSRRRPKPVKSVELDLAVLDPTATQVSPSWWLGIPRPISAFLDPFVNYPVHIGPEARHLVAYGEFKPVLVKLL
jgi:hypothetical protein